ncbi:MAG: YitT family protein [Bacilli bacterium]|jgi:uncharacterized membrane-anchored protein YitT (DUF2179 family)|nr:YitT family protein [Bacilli bacterium]HHU24728.1 YitT family protein [Acholeplasmataceae bacterium]
MVKNLINKQSIKEFLMINLGVFLAALSFALFLDKYDVVIGGVSGLGIIIKHILWFEVSTPLIVLIINIILLLLSWILLGKSFFLKTIYGSVMFPVFAWIVELVMRHLPEMVSLSKDNDYFLIITISAVLMGVGLGLAMKYGASTGGVDIIQYALLKYLKMPLSLSIIFIDGIVILYGAIEFRSLATALYGIIFMFISGYFIDNIIFGGFNVRSAHIITQKPAEIKQRIFEVLGRGVTEVYARGGYSGNEMIMLICVLRTREYYQLRSLVQEIDDKAFIFVNKAAEVRGEGFTFEYTDSN